MVRRSAAIFNVVRRSAAVFDRNVRPPADLTGCDRTRAARRTTPRYAAFRDSSTHGLARR
jgi:hypothetical protein